MNAEGPAPDLEVAGNSGLTFGCQLDSRKRLHNLRSGASGDCGRLAARATITIHGSNPWGEAMRKLVMAAALVLVAACGEQTEAPVEETTTAAPADSSVQAAVDSLGAMVDSMGNIVDTLQHMTGDSTH